MSRYIVVDNKIIGGCLIMEADIISYYELITSQEDFPKNTLKLHTNLNYFENKSGIYDEYIFIKPEYRNKGYAQILLDYIDTLPYDYFWEMSQEKKSFKYWKNKKDRKIFMEWDDEDYYGKSYITYKDLK